MRSLLLAAVLAVAASAAAAAPPLPGAIVSFGGSVLLCDDLADIRAIADAGRESAAAYAAKVEELGQTPSRRFVGETACLYGRPPPLVLVYDLVEVGDGVHFAGRINESWAVELRAPGFRAWTIFHEGKALTPA